MISTWMRSEEPDDTEPEATLFGSRFKPQPSPKDEPVADLVEIPDEQEPDE